MVFTVDCVFVADNPTLVSADTPEPITKIEKSFDKGTIDLTFSFFHLWISHLFRDQLTSSLIVVPVAYLPHIAILDCRVDLCLRRQINSFGNS